MKVIAELRSCGEHGQQTIAIISVTKISKQKRIKYDEE